MTNKVRWVMKLVTVYQHVMDKEIPPIHKRIVCVEKRRSCSSENPGKHKKEHHHKKKRHRTHRGSTSSESGTSRSRSRDRSNRRSHRFRKETKKGNATEDVPFFMMDASIRAAMKEREKQKKVTKASS